MQKNLGNFERLARGSLGVIALALLWERGEVGVSEGIVALLAVFLLLNATLGRCYLWRLLGLNTNTGTCDIDEASLD